MISDSELDARRRLAIEMILESEGLADDLQDDEADAKELPPTQDIAGEEEEVVEEDVDWGQTPSPIPSAGKEISRRDFSLRGVVDRYEGDYAVLVFNDGQRLLWPRVQLPAGAREGVAVTTALSVDLMDTEERSARLKGLLADINR